jgi:hypothetical protein
MVMPMVYRERYLVIYIKAQIYAQISLTWTNLNEGAFRNNFSKSRLWTEKYIYI